MSLSMRLTTTRRTRSPDPRRTPGNRREEPGILSRSELSLSLTSKRDLSAVHVCEHKYEHEHTQRTTFNCCSGTSAINNRRPRVLVAGEPLKMPPDTCSQDKDHASLMATIKTRSRSVKKKATKEFSTNCRQSKLGAMFNHRSSRLLLCVTTAFLSLLSLSVNLVHGQPPPPPPAGFLDFDNLPVTRFSCEGKVIGGYYADVETGCQMFHVCTLGQKDEVQDIKFLCLNGTVFDQETRVCERVDEVDCSQAEKFYDLNLDLYVPHATTSSTTTPAPTTTTTTTARPSPVPIPATSPKSSHHAKTFANSFNTNSNGFKGAAPAPERNSNSNADTQNNKGFSTYAYFHRTPHSVISSGYNSQLRQSYLINHQQGSNNNNSPSAPSSSTAPIVVETRTSQHSSSTSHGHGHGQSPSPTGRKVATTSGSAKTIVYTSTKPSVPSRQQQVVSSTTPKQQQYHHHQQSSSTVKSVPQQQQQPHSVTHDIVDPNSASLQVEYPEDDEYYDEAEDYATLVAGGGTGPSAPDAATILQNNHNLNTKIELSDRSSVNRVSKNISPATALNYNSNVKQQQVQTPRPSPVSILHQHQQQHHIIHDNSTEEPYYYEDEYEDHLQPQTQSQHQQSQDVLSRTAPVTGTGSSSSSSASENDSPEYYDENEEAGLDVNSHHFSHVDVPRIPFAKPNVPRVLVTNGKPFLPRLRRQSFYTHHLDPGSSLWNYYLNTVNSFNQNSDSESNNNRDSNLNLLRTPSR